MRDRISSHLCLAVPEVVFTGTVNTERALFLGQDAIEDLLPERRPKLYLSRAVILDSTCGLHALATVHVTEEMCQGHFEWLPMLPLAPLGRRPHRHRH